MPNLQRQTLPSKDLPPVHSEVVGHWPSFFGLPFGQRPFVGTWQSSPSVPGRQTHCPLISIFGEWQAGSVGTWQSSPTVPPRQTHCPPISNFGNWQVGCDPVPGGGQSLPWQPGSTKKHWPLRPILAPAGQDVVVVPPHVRAVSASRVQHVPFTRNVGKGQDVVVGGQFPSLLRGLPSAQTVVGGGGGGGGGGGVAPSGGPTCTVLQERCGSNALSSC